MKRSNKAMLAAGMLAGVCMLTGCASGGSAQPTPSPDVDQQQSAEPSPEASEEPAEDAPLSLTVDGKAVVGIMSVAYDPSTDEPKFLVSIGIAAKMRGSTWQKAD